MSDFPFGVIEGFYGRPWSWPARRAMVEFLQREQFNAYVYAPKSDDCLRENWPQNHDPVDFAQLLDLRTRCNELGILFGVGFSPWGLQSDYGPAERAQLQKRFEELNRLDCDLLCILFDDMPGAIDGLGQRQAEIVSDIAGFSNAPSLAMCPTYYSLDPVLDELFGKRPEDYWRTLGDLLPERVSVFWTGRLVVSPGYAEQDFSVIAEKIRRKPLLWDNYPVNDDERMRRFLHLLPVRDRPAQMREWCGGHLANPMNQAFLSQLPLASLAQSYRLGDDYDADRFWRESIEQYAGPELARLLRRDVERFQKQGLDALAADERQRLLMDYARIDHPAAVEVCAWLGDERPL